MNEHRPLIAVTYATLGDRLAAVMDALTALADHHDGRAAAEAAVRLKANPEPFAQEGDQ